METKALTIMFTDMKGFTSMTSFHSRNQTTQLLGAEERIIESTTRHFKGRVVKNLGDGHMIVFDSPTNAVLCGTRIQRLVSKYNSNTSPSERFELRIGINSGEVSLDEKDIFGEPVNLAARVMGGTPPGEVYFTEAVYLGMNRNEIEIAEVGTKTYKGIREKINVYKVIQDKSPLVRLGLTLKAFDMEVPKSGVGRHFKYMALLIGFFIFFGWMIQPKSKTSAESTNLTTGPQKILQEVLGDVSTPSATLEATSEAQATSTAEPSPSTDNEFPGKAKGKR